MIGPGKKVMSNTDGTNRVTSLILVLCIFYLLSLYFNSVLTDIINIISNPICTAGIIVKDELKSRKPH